MTGWIKLHRSITTHWLWQDAERFQWWCDLLMMAAYTERKQLVGRQLVTLKTGQLIASTSFLCQRWKRSRPMVEGFINTLVSDGMLCKEMAHNVAILTITNYTYLCADVNTDKQRGNGKVNADVDTYLYADPYTHLDTYPYATNKEINNIKNIENNNTNSSSCVKRTRTHERFQKPTVEEVDQYIREKGYTFDAEAFVSYYESNGWRVGRNPMKDWRAACRTWQGKEPKGKKTKEEEEYDNYYGDGAYKRAKELQQVLDNLAAGNS